VLGPLITPDQVLSCILSISLFSGRPNAGFVSFQVFIPGAKQEHLAAAGMDRQKLINSFITRTKRYCEVITALPPLFAEIVFVNHLNWPAIANDCEACTPTTHIPPIAH
jgi:hypothetical protein